MNNELIDSIRISVKGKLPSFPIVYLISMIERENSYPAHFDNNRMMIDVDDRENRTTSE